MFKKHTQHFIHHMKTLITLLVLLGILFLVGCSKSASEQITGAAVSELQTQEQPKVSQPPEVDTSENVKQISCADECNQNSCDGWKFVKCDEQADGCKDKVEAGLVKGKCGVVCLSNSDCTSKQKCTVNYECKEPESIIYFIGEDVIVDDLVYKATKAESFTKMGTSFFEKVTTGKFVKIYLRITNTDKETQQIFTPRFKLADSQDRKFDRIADDILYISDGISFGEQLQPGLPLEGAIVFEVPKDSTNLQLEISGDWTSVSKVVIAVNEVKSIIADTTLKAEQQKLMDEVIKEVNEQMGDYPKQVDGYGQAKVGEISRTVKGVTLTLKGITYEVKGEDYAIINGIDFEIVNEGSETINPEIVIYLWDENDPWEHKTLERETIELDTLFGSLSQGEYETKKATVRIPVNDIKLIKHIKLTAVEAYKYRPRTFVSVEYDLNITKKKGG